MENEPTSIPLKKGTRNRLGKFGDKNESWDNLLNRLMTELESTRKENKSLSEIRELVCDPIKNHIFESTPEEIDQLDLSGDFFKEFEKRVKRFWKKFAKE